MGVDEVVDEGADTVADLAEEVELLFGCARSGGGVGKVPVDDLDGTGEAGTGAVGLRADGDDEVEALGDELVEGLSHALGDVDAELAHDLNGAGVDTGGVGARGVGVEAVGGTREEEGLGHLGTDGVVSADDEDSFGTSGGHAEASSHLRR